MSRRKLFPSRRQPLHQHQAEPRTRTQRDPDLEPRSFRRPIADRGAHARPPLIWPRCDRVAHDEPVVQREGEGECAEKGEGCEEGVGVNDEAGAEGREDWAEDWAGSTSCRRAAHAGQLDGGMEF